MSQAKRHVFPSHDKSALKFSNTFALSVVIMADRPPKKLKSYGNTSLIKLKNQETIINRQIAVIKAKVPNVEIVVICGYDAKRLIMALPQNVIVIHNDDYENNNEARTFFIGINAITKPNALFLYGDLVFANDIFDDFVPNGPGIFYGHNNLLNKKSVGCTFSENGEVVEHICCDLPNKWSKISYFDESTIKTIKQMSCDTEKYKWLGSELLNQIPNLKVYYHDGPIIQIGSTNDLGTANKKIL